jgi:hypothetical protein
MPFYFTNFASAGSAISGFPKALASSRIARIEPFLRFIGAYVPLTMSRSHNGACRPNDECHLWTGGFPAVRAAFFSPWRSDTRERGQFIVVVRPFADTVEWQAAATRLMMRGTSPQHGIPGHKPLATDLRVLSSYRVTR